MTGESEVRGRRSRGVSEMRRARIVEALGQLMASQGYDGASMGDVAALAGMNQGLIHYHFKSKLDILLALQERLAARHMERLEARMREAGEGPHEQLEAFLDCHLRLGPEADPQAVACWVWLGGEALREPRVRAGFQTTLGRLLDCCREVLARGVARGVFRCQPENAAPALLAAIQGYYLLGATARELVPRGSAAQAVRAMAWGLTHDA